jgi:hypothetical protein
MYASKRITHKPCHNPLHIIFNHDLYDLSLHDLLSSILSRLTQQIHSVTTHSNLRTFLLLSHPCPILTLLHMSLTHLNPPLLPSSSHKERHPHLLTKHVHTTHTQRQAHIITHHTWLTQSLQHTTLSDTLYLHELHPLVYPTSTLLLFSSSPHTN